MRRANTQAFGRQFGITALELALAIGVIASFAAFLLIGLLRAEEMGERTAVQMTIMNFRSALRLRMAHYIISGQEAEIPKLVGANPAGWMQPPPGYLGEFKGVKASDMKQGTWYFDGDRRELVYSPRLDSALDPSSGGRPALRWRVQGGTSTGMVRGINLVATEQVSWFGAPMR